MSHINEDGATMYQQISYDGQVIKEGWRRQEPCHLIDWEKLEGKTVLDLGCNNGMMSIQAKEAGASKVVGVDYGEMIPYARRLRDHLQLDIDFWRMDLNSTEFLNFCPEFDVVFCCAIFRYMHNKPKFLIFLDRVTKEILYLETNHKTMAQPVLDQIKEHTIFSTRVLGYSGNVPDKPRVGHFMIRCRKQVQWADWPTRMIPIKLLRLTHDIEGFKKEIYPSGTYEYKLERITLLADDIEKYGLKEFLFVKEFSSGPNVGAFRVVEGHHRAFALKELEKRGRVFDAPCKVFPSVPSNWIRSHGLDIKDYSEIYEVADPQPTFSFT